jgi:hypothetical protein
MQRADRFRGVSRSPAGKVKAAPVVKEYPQRKSVPRAFHPLGCRRFLPLSRRIPALRHVSHDGRGSLACFPQGKGGTCAQRYAPFLTVQRVLTQESPTAARRHTDGKPTLPIVENELVLATALNPQQLDFSLG